MARRYPLLKFVGLLFSLLLIQSGKAVYAQGSYHPFPSNSAQWIYQYYDDFGQPWGWYHTYTLAGDTLIGMTVYSKLYDQGTYAGAVREQQKKVWFIPDTGSAEALLYDFNLITGDTLTGSYGGTVFGPSDTVQVVYEDSVPCSDGMRHRIWFSNGAQWIEGIGSNNYLLVPLLFAGLSGNDYLECFSNDTNTIFPPGVTGCFTGISEQAHENNPVTISPNPVSSISKITWEDGPILQEMILYDLNGKTIEATFHRLGSSTYIDRKGIPAGMYLLKIRMHAGRSFRTRLIIADEN
ncbi:MAG: T9SS type A sorting domain-containing protein [Bacteroidota bacterium]